MIKTGGINRSTKEIQRITQQIQQEIETAKKGEIIRPDEKKVLQILNEIQQYYGRQRIQYYTNIH